MIVRMEASKLSSLSNPLATADQLTHSASQLDGVSLELERTLRYDGCLLTQAAGILLRLNQDVIAQAIVTFSRFYVGSEGGSFRENGIKVSPATEYMTELASSDRSGHLGGGALSDRQTLIGTADNTVHP